VSAHIAEVFCAPFNVLELQAAANRVDATAPVVFAFRVRPSLRHDCDVLLRHADGHLVWRGSTRACNTIAGARRAAMRVLAKTLRCDAEVQL
jgi:hypothetical protein